MDFSDDPKATNGHAGLNHGLSITTGGTGPRRARNGTWAPNESTQQIANDRNDGGCAWRVTFVTKAGGPQGPRTAVFDSESDFRSFQEHLGSNGSTVIRMQRRSVTPWEDQH